VVVSTAKPRMIVSITASRNRIVINKDGCCLRTPFTTTAMMLALYPLLARCLFISLLLSLLGEYGLVRADDPPPLPSQDSVTDYAPSMNVECPDLSRTSLIREFTPENQTLHPQEVEYINTRASTVLPDAWKEWLGGSNAKHGYDLTKFQTLPKVGLAIPGGGLRAALYGAACLNALDARNDSAKAAGTGGLLQVASYITGLSGMPLS
jgi:hypothetical protein